MLKLNIFSPNSFFHQFFIPQFFFFINLYINVLKIKIKVQEIGPDHLGLVLGYFCCCPIAFYDKKNIENINFRTHQLPPVENREYSAKY